MNTLTATNWVLVGLCCAVCPVFIISGIYRFRKAGTRYGLRHVQVRRPRIITYIGLWSLFHLIFERPFSSYYVHGWMPNTEFSRFVYLCLPALPMISFYLVLRVWLVYRECVLHSPGEEVLDLLGLDQGKKYKPQARVSIHRFAVSEAKTRNFGSGMTENMTQVLLAIPCLLYMIIHLMVVVLFGDTFQASILTSCVFVWCPLIAVLFLLAHLPWDKNFKLKAELVYIVGFLVFSVLVTAIVNVIISDFVIRYFCHSLCMVLFVTIAFFIQTHGVLYALNDHNVIATDAQAARMSMVQQQQTKMKTALSNAEGFAHFQDFLRGEFSTENLKFFVEVTKFRKIVKSWLEQTKGTDYVKSSLDKNEFDDMEFKWVVMPDDFQHFFVKMYAKYIFENYVSQVKSIAPLNIPSVMRKQLEQNVEFLEGEELYDVFDQCQNESWLLMTDTFRRFERTEDFVSLLGAHDSTSFSMSRKSQKIRPHVSTTSTISLKSQLVSVKSHLSKQNSDLVVENF